MRARVLVVAVAMLVLIALGGAAPNALANPSCAATMSPITSEDTIAPGLDPACTGNGTLVITDDSTNGSTVDNLDGTFDYLPGANFSGTDNFTVTVTDDDGPTVVAVTVTVDPVADIALAASATAGAPSVFVGNAVTWTFAVTNGAGAETAAGVTATVTVPSHTLFGSLSTSAGSCAAPSNGAVLCFVGTLAAGQSVTFTLRGTADSVGIATGAVAATGSGSFTDDVSDDSASASTTVKAFATSGGSDAVTGTSGNDNIATGGGADTITATAGNDTINGGPGIDTIDLSDCAGASINLAIGILTGCGGTTQVAGIENVIGSSGPDVIVGGSGSNYIVGGSGNDRLFGGGGNDRIFGGTGADRISGGTGNDAVRGGSGSDGIDGGAGADRISADTGNDNVHAGSGNDVVRGGSGNDRLSGERGDDRLLGDTGRDRLRGGDGSDVLRGGDGNDVLYGGPGPDRLLGEGGYDMYFGGAGLDTGY